MPADVCVVCGNSRGKDSPACFHASHSQKPDEEREMDVALCLDEGDLRNYNRVCSRHFLNADARHIPDITLGKHFASPRKRPLLLQFATSCFLFEDDEPRSRDTAATSAEQRYS